MDSSTRQQAYDRGHTIFSPDGRLYQVEYAREAVERGSPSLGIRTNEGTVLAARKPVRSPLLEPETVEKIHRVDDHVAIASAGHAADARRLVEFARDVAQRHRLRYGEPVAPQSLTKTIADRVQEYTQTGGSRPYGTALLVAGVDERNRGRPNESTSTSPSTLFEIDPSGTPYGWRATAIGDGADEIRRFLEERLEPDTSDRDERTGSSERVESLDRGIEIALEALDATGEGPLTTAALDVHVVRPATESELSRISRISNDRLADALGTGASDGPAS